MPVARAVPVLLVLALAACSRPAGSRSEAALDPARPLPSPVPEVVARVNGESIRISQILPMAKAELDRVPDGERDQKKPEVLRRALQQYIDRELLLQEALARGIRAAAADVDWSYDQMRRAHPDEAGWSDFLASQGMDPQSFRAELRAQKTVSALIEQETRHALGGESDAARLQEMKAGVQQTLVARLRAKARIETFL